MLRADVVNVFSVEIMYSTSKGEAEYVRAADKKGTHRLRAERTSEQREMRGRGLDRADGEVDEVEREHRHLHEAPVPHLLRAAVRRVGRALSLICALNIIFIHICTYSYSTYLCNHKS